MMTMNAKYYSINIAERKKRMVRRITGNVVNMDFATMELVNVQKNMKFVLLGKIAVTHRFARISDVKHKKIFYTTFITIIFILK